MTVYILVTIPKPELLRSCTLVFESIRIGFPSAKINVTLNLDPRTYLPMLLPRLQMMGENASWNWDADWHHGGWVRTAIEDHVAQEGPMVILDGDIIFWENVEDWEIKDLYAGYYVPTIYNDFAQCISVPRLHSSFMWIPDAKKLLEALHGAYGPSNGLSGEYCPCDPFMPSIKFNKQRPYFWDTCANMYNMIGGQSFTPEQVSCYEHLNSAAFFDVMSERLENKSDFKKMHTELINDPDSLRGLSEIVGRYYREKNKQASRVLHGG